MFVLADDLEPLPPELAHDNSEGYRMCSFGFGRARIPVYDDDITARAKRLRNLKKHPFRIAEFMISVADQHCVHGAHWQPRIPLFSDDDVNIVSTPY